jgi:hypothetical protein
MSSRRGRWLSILSVGVVFAMGLAGCGEGSGSNVTATARYFNALLGVQGNTVDFISPRGGVFITQAGQVQLGAIAPLAGSLLLNSPTGIETFQVVSTGTTAPTLAAIDASLVSNTRYLIATTGIVGQAGQTAPRMIFRTDVQPILAINQSAIRVVHLSPDASSLDLFNTPVGGQPAAITGLTNLAYTSVSNYAIVTSGTFNLSVRQAGTTTVIPTQTSTANVALISGKAYTIFLFGQANPNVGQPTFNARIVEDN